MFVSYQRERGQACGDGEAKAGHARIANLSLFLKTRRRGLPLQCQIYRPKLVVSEFVCDAMQRWARADEAFTSFLLPTGRQRDALSSLFDVGEGRGVWIF